MQENVWDNPKLIKVLKEKGVVIMPTDTIYGMVARAESEESVERIYKIRKRSPDKPCIILIGDISELAKFSVNISDEQKNIIQNFTAPTSFILDCSDEKLFYLHRGTNSLAFRIPALPPLRDLLLKTGPLIAPSANTEKFPASENITDAREYFGDAVDLYVDGGSITSKASKVIKLHSDGSITIIRE